MSGKREGMVDSACLGCGEPLTYAGVGTYPKFCSPRCRVKHWRWTKTPLETLIKREVWDELDMTLIAAVLDEERGF